MKKFILLLALCSIGWLALPAEAQTSNTFVRFRFSYGGTVFGDVEVELFNQDKPVTVSNFLHYVRSGGYRNTILHRADPAINAPTIVQGGASRLHNPFSRESVFSINCFDLVPTNAPITNEFNVGPIRNNTLGTLAMALTDGDPNSGTSSWFFNLVSNPRLDTTNGGYPVFGRVVKDSKRLLSYFTTVREGDGLYSGVPVAVRHGYPRVLSYSLFFTVDITELNSTNRADSSRPTVILTGPPTSFRLSNDTVTISGKAADKGMGLTEVRVYPDPCAMFPAKGTNNWSLTLTNVPPGTNTFEVESVDAAGNRSAIVRRSFFRVVPTPIGIVTNGSGAIFGLTNGQMVEIGRNYQLTAKPAPGHLFVNWRAERVSGTETNSISNVFTATTSSVQIKGGSNWTYMASFVPNLFPPLKGTYVGLFYNTNAYLTNGATGAMKIEVTDLGRFSGNLQTGNKGYPFSGTFHPVTGKVDVSFKGPGGRNYSLDSFRLNLTNQLETVTGFVLQDPNFSSPINLYRVRSGTIANPSPFKGSYTWAALGEAEPTVKPSGDSFGNFTVSKTGTVTFSGTMADGTPVSAGGPIGTNGVWGLRTALYSGAGSILSWVTVDTNRVNEDLFGTFYWFHPALPKAKFYTNAFTASTSITGARYVASMGTTNRVLTNFVMSGSVALLDGNLPGPQTNLVMLLPNNTVTNQSTNKLTFTLTKTTGLFSGTVAPTNQARSITYKGAILQKQGYGSGFHLDTNRSGRVYFGP